MLTTVSRMVKKSVETMLVIDPRFIILRSENYLFQPDCFRPVFAADFYAMYLIQTYFWARGPL